VYLDPRIRDRLVGRRVVVVDDVISTGRSMLALLQLLARAGFDAAGIVTAMQETRVWQKALAAADPRYPRTVHSVLKSPLFRRTCDGWMPDPDTFPDGDAADTSRNHAHG
jgi:hypoxanthine phosphoribosyltransferase